MLRQPKLQLLDRAIVIMVSLFFIFGFSGSVLAATTSDPKCDCWCGKDSLGSWSIGKYEFDQCPDKCSDSSLEFIVCANDTAATPLADMRCWTQTNCEAPDDEGNKQGDWEENISKWCAKETKESFCYPPETDISLGVSLGSTGEVKDISDYLNTFFVWLLYSSVIFAAVMVIIGGIEYMIGAGTEKTQQAVGRIRGAVIGFVLIMLSYTILYNVNPQIVKMQLPRNPKIKQALFIDPETTCEALLEKGWKIKYREAELDAPMSTPVLCGESAEILEGPGGIEATLDNCFFNYCPTGGCMLTKYDQPPSCVKCEDVYPGNVLGLTPSEKVCEAINYETRGSGSNKVIQKCFFSQDASFGVAAKTSGTCALATIDCGTIKSCMHYDHVPITAHEGGGRAECIVGEGIVFTEASIWGNICISNLCDINLPYDRCFPYVHSTPPIIRWDCRNLTSLADLTFNGCLDKDRNAAKGMLYCGLYMTSDATCPLKL